MEARKAPTRSSETQLFRDVFNASPIGIALENLEGQPLFVNPAFCSMLGFSEEELRSKHCIDFSPAEDAEKDWALFQQLRAGSIDHYQLEKRYFRRDGSLLWGRLSLSLLKNHPSPLVLAMVEDITDKKQAEEARFRHAAIIESSDDAIVSGTLEGIIESWNPGAEKIYGYTEAEAVGQSITMLIPRELPDEENKILETLRAGGRIEHFETVRLTKTGKRINVSLTVSPIKDSNGRIVGISGIARDITERKRAEEALRASEERLRLAQWAAHIGTFDLNIRTGVDIWQPETEALYGLSPGGFGGTLTAFEDLIHPDDRERIIELTQEMMRTGQPAEGEWRVVWPDGSVHWIAGRGHVLMDESGEPLRMVGVNIDVTERKLAEQTIAEMTRKLIEAQEQERARIGRELHDDINQRLALLVVEMEASKQNPPNSREDISQLLAKLQERLVEVSSDVQSISHQLHSSQLEYLGIVGAMRSFCREFAARQKVEVNFTSHDVPKAVSNEIALCLFRVLQEALHNAVKHSHVRHFEVNLGCSENQLQLTVSDRGAGFDSRTSSKGTGLGLVSMRERVRLVGGTISIDSKPKGGTTIHVRVPFGSERFSERAVG
jgi:PAS domain S-box-containing protein